MEGLREERIEEHKQANPSTAPEAVKRCISLATLFTVTVAIEEAIPEDSLYLLRVRTPDERHQVSSSWSRG
ncbi:MAG: hypothetical protein R6U93_02150 [Dehalococcoidia bacterium]